MSSRVPAGWEETSIGNYVGVQGGCAFKSEDFKEVGIPVVRISNINKDGRVDLTEAVYTQENPELSRFKIRNGDVLIAMSGATTGKVGRYRASKAAYLNQRVGRFYIRDTSKSILDFIHQVTSTDQFTGAVLIDAAGGAQPNISGQQIEAFRVLLPPLPEQQKIATILSSVDNVIEKTRAQIDKLKDLKTGMMQELLTKGIGHTEFKDSPVGRIPAEWSVGTLDSLGISILDGDRGKEYPKEKDFHDYEHCLFLSAKNVTKEGFIFSEMSFISKERDQLLRKGKLTRGDIVITTRGTVGNIAFYDDSVAFKDIRINSGMAIIRNDSSELDTQYLHLLMRSPIVSEQVELLAFGSAQPQLTIGIIKGLHVLKPSLDEQKAITSAVMSVNKKLQLAIKKQSLLASAKKALMQDLLTGKVRVTPDESAAQ